MKAAFKKADRTIELKDIASRSLGSDEIRVKVEACGICGTDFQPVNQESQFGHEIAGIVLEVGSSVSSIKKGQKVVLDSATPCGICAKCRNGFQELCINPASFFKLGSFGFAEELIAPAISAIPYSGLSPEIASLQEPLGVAIDIFRLSDISLDSNVLVFGQGPIGLMVLALAKNAGARKVFVSDYKKRTGRYDLAMKLGADEWIDPDELPLKEFDFSVGIDRIIVTTPPTTLPEAFEVASKGAIISFLGIGGEGRSNCTFNADVFHLKKLQLRASFASPALFGPLALQYLLEGKIDGESIVTRCFSLENIMQAIDFATNDPSSVKIIVTP